jgi:hypothetical protein
MASEETGHPQKKDDDSSKNIPTLIINDSDKIEKEESNKDSNNDYQTIRNSEDPIRIKIEEKRGWQRSEVIEIVGIVIGLVVLWVTFDTFRQTKRAVDISAKALDESIKKDSIADVRSEFESRPIITFSDFLIESIGTDRRTIVSFKIINMGKFPAIITKGRLALGTGRESSVENVEKSVGPGKEAIFNNYVFNTFHVSYTMTNDPLKDSIYKEYQEGTVFLYLVGELEYTSLGTNKKYLYEFVYEIGLKPTFSVIGLKVENTSLR